MDVRALRTLAATRVGRSPLRLWGHPLALARLPWLEGIEHHPVQVGETFCLGRYTIQPLAGNHWVDESQEQPLLYLFLSEAEKWFYATDTAWFPTQTWRRLAQLQLDAIIWDGTYGDELSTIAPLGQFGHNTLAMLRLILPTAMHEKVLKPEAQVILTHLSKNYHPTHEALENKLLADGMIPAFDGMVVQITAQHVTPV
jgi:phosphoribosyl 1,2-cyclic phosphate phosphodiesterase